MILKKCYICSKIEFTNSIAITTKNWKLLFTQKQSKKIQKYLQKHKQYVCSECKTNLLLSQLL